MTSLTDQLWLPKGTASAPKDDGGINTQIDLYDSDLLRIEQAVTALQRHANKPGDLGNIEDEIIERFGLQGYTVKVQWWVTEEPGPLGAAGTMIPSITIEGRVERGHEFDHEKMQYEVQTNILGIDDQPGAMTRDGSIKSPAKSTSMTGATKS
jgi:hypothetical protein